MFDGTSILCRLQVPRSEWWNKTDNTRQNDSTQASWTCMNNVGSQRNFMFKLRLAEQLVTWSRNRSDIGRRYRGVALCFERGWVIFCTRQRAAALYAWFTAILQMSLRKLFVLNCKIAARKCSETCLLFAIFRRALVNWEEESSMRAVTHYYYYYYYYYYGSWGIKAYSDNSV